MSDHDPLAIRKYFPVVDDATFLASASVCPSPIPAVEAGIDFVRSKGAIPYDLEDMLEKCDEVRGQFGRLINAKQTEIGLIYTTSEAENMIVSALNLQPGDNIVTDDLHYSASYVIYEQLAKRGIEVRLTKRQGLGSKFEEFEPLVDQHTRLLSVAWVSHQTGFCQDLRPLADLVHSVGGYLYADVIQGVGMIPLDVRAADLDFCAAGSYKWTLGNFGVANFFVRESLLPMFAPDRFGYFHVHKKLGQMAHEIYEDGRKFMYATPAFGAVYQLSAGLKFVEEVGVEKIAQHVVGLAHYLRQGLVKLGHEVLTPEENGSAIVAFKHGLEPSLIKESLAKENIHVNFREGGTQIRIGSALFNNQGELDHFLEVMKRISTK